jgi:amino acid transporter
VENSIDISTRDDVHKLKPGAVGLIGVLFAALSAAAPLTAMTGNTYVAIGLGNGIGAPAGFAFAAVVLVIFSVGYVAMARKISAAGGFYSFISHGLGRPIGVAAGFVGSLAYALFEAALLGFVGYLSHVTFLDKMGWDIPWPIFSLVALVVIAVLSHFDVELSVKVLGVVFVLEIICLVAMVVAIIGNGGGPDGLNWSSLNPAAAFQTDGFPAGAAGSVGFGLFMAFWSWVGFESTVNYAEESRDPARTVPRATYAAVLFLGILYTFVAFAMVSAWGSSEVVGVAGEQGGEFIFATADTVLPTFFVDVMRWLVILGAFGCAMALGHNPASRYWYSLGREGLGPRILGRTHPKHQSPHIASMFQSFVSLVILAVYAIGGRLDEGDGTAYATNAALLGAYTQLAVLGTLWILILQVLVSIAIPIWFMKHHQADAHPWKTIVAPVIAAVAQVFVIWLLIDNFSSAAGAATGLNRFTIPLAFTLLALGVAAALVIRSTNRDLYAQLGRFVNSGLAEEHREIPPADGHFHVPEVGVADRP